MQNKLSQCRHGQFIFNPQDMYVGRALDVYGEYSELEAQIYPKLLSVGDVVVEVGANIGAHTVPLARSVGETGMVIALEPQRIVYQILCGNLAVNSLGNTVAIWAAAAAAPGQLGVPLIDYGQVGNFGGIELHEKAMWKDQPVATERVPALTLDSINLSRCRLLKVDVEGMELDVLHGAQALLQRCRPIVLVENDRLERAADLVAALVGWGYTLYWHITPLYNPDNYRGISGNCFQGVDSVNMVGLPAGCELRLGLPPVTNPFHTSLAFRVP